MTENKVTVTKLGRMHATDNCYICYCYIFNVTRCSEVAMTFSAACVCGPLLALPNRQNTKWIITVKDGWRLTISGIYSTVSIVSYHAMFLSIPLILGACLYGSLLALQLLICIKSLHLKVSWDGLGLDTKAKVTGNGHTVLALHGHHTATIVV